MNNIIRKTVVINNPQQLKKFNIYCKDAGFGNFSHMIRSSVKESMTKFYGKSKQQELEAKVDELFATYHRDIIENIHALNEKTELMRIRITKENIGPQTPQATKEILKALLDKALDFNELRLRLKKKYSDEILGQAISFLIDSELIGIKSKSMKKRV